MSALYQIKTTTSVSLGSGAGGNATGSVAIGNFAGSITQETSCVAMGNLAGTVQSSEAVAIGSSAGNTAQGTRAVAVGALAGMTNQGNTAVAIGSLAGNSFQSPEAVAVGSAAGQNSQNSAAVAVGSTSGFQGQGAGAVAVGTNSGVENQGQAAVAIGSYSGWISQKADAVAVGPYSAYSGQGFNAVAMGSRAGYTAQGQSAVAVGFGAGYSGQKASAVAIGATAGAFEQGIASIAIGTKAGELNQGNTCVALGSNAGSSGQVLDCIAIGTNAGLENQQSSAIAIGTQAGMSNQTDGAVAVGFNAGSYTQGENAVAVGPRAGFTAQNVRAVAVGVNAGSYTQGEDAVAVGSGAGFTAQSDRAVAVGPSAGFSGQFQSAVAIGATAGAFNQGIAAVAIGSQAGESRQGDYCIAIGYQAGLTTQAAESIVLNATPSALNTNTSQTCLIKPVRLEGISLTGFNGMYYNPTTGEVVNSTLGGGGSFPNLAQVLAVGNDAEGLGMTGVGNLGVATVIPTNIYAGAGVGSANQVLGKTGSNALSWIDQSGGGGGAYSNTRSLYVDSSNQNPSPDGSINNPYSTIQASINYAELNFDVGNYWTIFVANGSYSGFNITKPRIYIQGYNEVSNYSNSTNAPCKITTDVRLSIQTAGGTNPIVGFSGIYFQNSSIYDTATPVGLGRSNENYNLYLNNIQMETSISKDYLIQLNPNSAINLYIDSCRFSYTHSAALTGLSMILHAMGGSIANIQNSVFNTTQNNRMIEMAGASIGTFEEIKNNTFINSTNAQAPLPMIQGSTNRSNPNSITYNQFIFTNTTVRNANSRCILLAGSNFQLQCTLAFNYFNLGGFLADNSFVAGDNSPGFFNGCCFNYYGNSSGITFNYGNSTATNWTNVIEGADGQGKRAILGVS